MTVLQVDYRQRKRDRVKADFDRLSADFTVQQLHREGDSVRLWRVGNPKTITRHSFRVCCPPGWMISYGDMGECMWCRSENMIHWAQSAIGSEGYFAEKVPNNIRIKEKCPELVEEWLAELDAELQEDPLNNELTEVLSELKLHWGWNEGDFEWMQRTYYESMYNDGDCEGIPDFEDYTYRYLWICQGIKWMIEQLDSGRVVQ